MLRGHVANATEPEVGLAALASRDVELTLIRHGLPETIRRESGPADPPLNEIGVEQAQRMADWLRDEGIDQLACSPMQRALQTAAPLADVTGLDIEVVDGFAEMDRDSREYVPWEVVQREKGARYEAMLAGDWDALGMTDPEVFRRTVGEAADAFLSDARGEHVAIVCHGGTINTMVMHLTGLQGNERGFFMPHYTSLNRLRPSIREDGSWFIRSLNETAHLSARRDTLTPLAQP